MRWFLFTLLVFTAGLGTGFYLWGVDDVPRMSREIKASLGTLSSAEPERADVAKKELTAADITSGVIGTWRSDDDSKFQRTFSVDATVVDTYEGDEAVTEGRWAVFTAPEGEPPPFPIAKGTVYLRLSFLEEVLYFKVVALTNNNLELVFLDGGGVQNFTRQ